MRVKAGVGGGHGGTADLTITPHWLITGNQALGGNVLAFVNFPVSCSISIQNKDF